MSTLQDVIDATEAIKQQHICQANHAHLASMKELYAKLLILPTSEVADCVLIRSHVAYHAGQAVAARVKISPSRGHSYKIEEGWRKIIVRITDPYDHRQGVAGYIQADTTISTERN